MPNLVLNYTLKPSRWGQWLQDVPAIPERTMDIIKYGADIEFKIEVSNLDKFSFTVFEGPQGLAVLDTIVENLCMGKFLGPFPPHMTH